MFLHWDQDPGTKTDASPCVSTPSSLPFNLHLPPPVPLFSLLDHIGLHLFLVFLAPLGNGLYSTISHKRDIQTRPEEAMTSFTNDLTPVQILSSLFLSSFASSLFLLQHHSLLKHLSIAHLLSI